MNKKKLIHLNSYISALIALVLAISIIRYPEDAFEASLYGLKLWFEVVLPALLPFFAMADILMGLGVVHFIGVLLEPVMKPVFRIPGVGAFAVAMGLASGYPIGAKITGRLRRQNLCSQVEGERLVSFANTADPLFMVGAVAIGMFGMPELGVTIAISHYLAVVLVGFLMRFHGGPEKPKPLDARKKKGYFTRALRELVTARAKDGRPFGQLFNEAIRDTFGAMLFVGGCIMMFSVLIRVLTVAGVINAMAGFLTSAFAFANIAPDIIHAFVSGTFEITIGSQAASNAQADMIQKAVAASAIIAWSGFSVHTQVAAMVHDTDIRVTPYIIARFLHAIFAGVITLLFMGPARGVVGHLQATVPVFLGSPWVQPTFLTRLWTSTQWALVLFVLLITLGVLVSFSQRIVFVWFRKS